LNPERETTNRQNAEHRLGATATGRGRAYDLEDRLLEFASRVIDVLETLPKTRAGDHIAGPLLRAETSPYGNHGEAQTLESRDDFIHKLKACLKELRETRRWARLVERKNWLHDDPDLAFVLRDVEELIRIFKASIQTAERNRIAVRSTPNRVRSIPQGG
jgi:four helix bundle protein